MSSRTSRTRGQARAQSRPAARRPTGAKRPWSWRKRILVGLAGALGLGVVAVVVAYALIRIPQPNDLATAQASIIYFSDGKTELGRLSGDSANRESVTIDKIPKVVQEAIVAAEDRSFYENAGISPVGIARAAWDTLKGSSTAGGGSTITQQYVKNYFLTSDRSLIRKAKEILISVKIEQQESKDQILENYLNTIYFGRGAWGIQTAAKAYFNKDVSRLTRSEAALLASVIRAPSAYDPGLSPDALASAKKRWNYVQDGMVTMGYLTAAERATQVFPKFIEYVPPTQSGTNGYLIQMVRDELTRKYQLDEGQIGRAGLRIVSTIDVKRQAAAVQAVREGLPRGVPGIQAGLASIVPGDGAISAAYAGADYAKRQRNAVTQDHMQAGSTFKIFTLVAALGSGKVNLESAFDGRSPMFFDEFKDPGNPDPVLARGGVNNAGNESYGSIDVLRATASSVNTVYAQLNLLATPEATMKAAQALGVRSDLAANPGNVLGTDYVTVLDMATAYATIAAKGTYAEPYIVRSVTNVEDTIDITAQKVTKRVFSEAIMADTIAAMRTPIQYGTARYAQNLGRPAAGKTGTTLGSRSAWFDGFVPQLATAVGIFGVDPKTGGELVLRNLPNGIGTINGGNYPTQIWTEYMKVALEGVDVVEFPARANVNPDARPRTSSSPSPSPSPSLTSATPTPTSSTAPSPTSTPTQTPTETATPTPSVSPSGSPSPEPTP